MWQTLAPGSRQPRAGNMLAVIPPWPLVALLSYPAAGRPAAS
jgi:hypothetical protein